MCSVTARAASLLYPGVGTKQIAERMLGEPERSFGGILPNNATLLLERIPAILGYSVDSILAGSAFHLLSPFLEVKERSALRDSLFASQGRGNRNWYSAEPLRYCPGCAEEDAAHDRPAHWRVLPNLPAITCCDLHRRRLVVTRAQICRRTLHDPGLWISNRWPESPLASAFEIALAQDARWLYQQRSTAAPGAKRLAVAIKSLLLDNERYVRGSGRLCLVALLEDAAALLGNQSLPVQIHVKAIASMSLARISASAQLQVFSLLAYLAGHRLQEVFASAAGDQPRCASQDHLLERAKRRLAHAQKLHPAAGRTELAMLDDRAVRVLRERDRPTYEKLVPKSRRLRSAIVDWGQLDQAYAEKIRLHAATLNPQTCTTVQALLATAGIPRKQYDRGKGRLTLTKTVICATLGRLKLTRRIDRARERLAKLRENRPSLCREDFERLSLHAAEVLRRYDQPFYHQSFDTQGA